MRRFLRKTISTFLYPMVCLRREGTLRILTYHRVNRAFPKDRLSVNTDRFRRQMAWLYHHGYQTLSPEQLLEVLQKKKPFPEKSVLLTFDDGYQDNFTEAFPVLREFGFQATVFVATDLVGKTHDGHRMLRWDEMKEMADHGISFGSHTVHHGRMDQVPPDRMRQELDGSKHLLEEKLGKKIVAFSYPFGNVHSESKAAVAFSGYEVAFTTRPGPVRRDSDRFHLPRTEISAFDSHFDFRKKLAGAFDWLHDMVQRRQIPKGASQSCRTREGTQPIPVLYVIWSLGLGGAEQVVMALARKLNRKRFRPLVVCLNDPGPFSEILEKEGICVVGLGKKGKFDFSVIPKLVRMMKTHRIQIVHTHLWGGNVWGRIAARLSGAKVVIATEHSYAGKPKFFYLVDWILSWITDRIVVVSEEVRDFYAHQLKIKSRRLQVIHNGIDLPKFDGFRRDGLRRELGIGEETPLLGMVGRLAPVKAHEVFFEAVARLKERHPSLVATLIGEGERRKALERLCREHGIEKEIQFLGLRKDVRQLLPHLDMVVLSSDKEGFSMTLLEAMAAGVPVVATDVGGNSELVVEGETGFLVPPRNPVLLADRIDRLIRDRELAKRMGRQGQERARCHFSLEKMVADTESLYEDLLGESRRFI